MSLAVKGGPNAATQAEEFRVNRYGVSGGLAGDVQGSLTERFSVGGQIELLYSPRGAEVVFEGEHVGQVRQHYVDLTVAVRPGARFGRASVYALLGGGLNVLLSASKDDAAGEGQDITDGLRRYNVALLAGAGVAVRISQRELGPFRTGSGFLEGRYDHGLLDTDLAGGFKSRTMSIMVGVSFVVGGGAASTGPVAPVAGVTGRSASAP